MQSLYVLEKSGRIAAKSDIISEHVKQQSWADPWATQVSTWSDSGDEGLL